MTEPVSDPVKLSITDILRMVKVHYRASLAAALIAAVAVALLTAVYFVWLQPVRRAAALDFRPTFDGASAGRYPNGLPFAPSDVAAGPIVDLVYDANLLKEYCEREVFRSGFFVEQRSDRSAALDAEYQGRLADSRITSVERQLLQAEYQAKRQALPLQYRLVFVKPRPCAAIPQVVVAKAMTDVLTTWATESETKRGVLNHQVEVLTPGMLDVGLGRESSKLLRADLIRTAIWRIITNISGVESIPGAALVRQGPDRLTFMEVRNRLVDLNRSRLEPLVASAGQSMVRESLSWVVETVAAAEREQKAAQGKADANRMALQLYSGMGSPVAPGRPITAGGTTSATDVQTLSPQIDSTFIDRIVEMSAANTTFRQELTTSMVQANIEAVAAEERLGYYRRLLQSLRESNGPLMSEADIDQRLDDIVAQGKALTKQFNDLYVEFSRVSLRAAAALYQTERPVTIEVYRQFTGRDYLMLVVWAFVVTLLVTFGYLASRDRLRVMFASPAP